MKKYTEPDISLLYFEAEHIAVGEDDEKIDVQSKNMFAPDDSVTVTDSVKFADIQQLK